MSGGLDIEALRAATPGCAIRAHLNNAGAGLLSAETLLTMTAHLEREAQIGGYEAAAEAADGIAATYEALAALLGGRADEIALFDNSTHAWNAAFYSLRLEPGDRILTGRNEYGSNVLAYLQIAERRGVEVLVVPNDEHGQLDTGALTSMIDDRTRLIGVTHIPTSGGLVNPAAEVGRIARSAGVPYLLDATQSVGQLPLDVAEIGCDMLTGTGRKFLRGPRGTGFLWVRRDFLPNLEPFVVEIEAATWNGARGFRWHDGARRFETWEKNVAGVLGLGSAVRQALTLGLDAIAARAVDLGATLRERLGAIEGVTTHDLGMHRCAIVTAGVAGRSAAEVATTLGVRRINVSTTSPEHTQFDTEERRLPSLVRLSPHYYTTEREIDAAVAVMAEIAQSRMEGSP